MATVRWLGAAQDIQQVDTYEFTDTWAAGDTVSWEINSKVLTLTVDTADTETIALEAKAMFLAKTPIAGLVGSETRNFGSQQIPEFIELDTLYGVSVSGSILTLKWTAGVEVTIVSSVATAGDGDVTHVAATAATGKNFFDNGDNWEGGSVPNAGDTILFDQGSVDVKYALDNATLDLNLVRKNGYKGNIGLLPNNPLGYVEYRDRYLSLPITATSGTQVHSIGQLTSSVTPKGFTFIDLGTNDGSSMTVLAYDTQPFDENSVGHALQIVGGQTSRITISGGSVGIGLDLTANQTEVYALYVSPGGTSSPVVRLGDNCACHASALPIEQSGGTLVLDTITSPPGAIIFDGKCHLNGTSNYGDLFIHNGGEVYRNAGSVTDITIYEGGVFDTTQANTDTTTGAMVFYKGFVFRDPNDRLAYTSGIDFYGCSPSDGTFVVAPHKTWTPSTI